jgi:hypothetical protein
MLDAPKAITPFLQSQESKGRISFLRKNPNDNSKLSFECLTPQLTGPAVGRKERDERRQNTGGVRVERRVRRS